MSIQRCRKGFSMIELLVVMFLIAFMVAFITKVFIDASRNGKIRAARALLHKLDLALHDYFQDFGTYPPDSGYGLDPKGGQEGKLYDACTLYRYLGKELEVTEGPLKGRRFGPYVPHFTDQEKQPLKDSNDPDRYVIVDPWLTPIGYIGSRARVLHNRDGVDLFSCGPDRKTATDKDSGEHGPYPPECDHDNNSYDGNAKSANAVGLGHAIYNGALTVYKLKKNINNTQNKSSNEVLDDINNWDPEN